jgi:hypothetical protein
MRKLKLEIDSLDVQSFQMDDSDDTPGTVHAASGTLCQSTSGCGFTDYETCGGHAPTCDESCYGTCFSCVDDTCQCC